MSSTPAAAPAHLGSSLLPTAPNDLGNMSLPAAVSDDQNTINAGDITLDLPKPEKMTGQIWCGTDCFGLHPNEVHTVELNLDRAYVTLINMIQLRSKSGYSGRDFLFYKKRCAVGGEVGPTLVQDSTRFYGKATFIRLDARASQSAFCSSYLLLL